MYSKALVLSISIAVFVAISAAISFSSHHEDPQIELSYLTPALIEGSPNESVDGSIWVRNLGGKPLTFDVLPTCGCTRTDPKSGTVEPGTATPVSFTLTLPAQSGATKTVAIHFQSNDPLQPRATFAVTSKVRNIIKAEPSSVDFGTIAIEELPNASAKCKVTPLIDAATEIRARIVQGQFSVNVDGHTLTIKPLTGLSVGHHHGTVLLDLGQSDNNNCHLAIRAVVTSSLYAVPSTITLRNQSGDFVADGILCSMDGPLGELQLAAAPSGITLTETGRINDHRCRFRLAGPASLDLNRFEIEIKDSKSANTCKMFVKRH